MCENGGFFLSSWSHMSTRDVLLKGVLTGMQHYNCTNFSVIHAPGADMLEF